MTTPRHADESPVTMPMVVGAAMASCVSAVLKPVVRLLLTGPPVGGNSPRPGLHEPELEQRLAALLGPP